MWTGLGAALVSGGMGLAGSLYSAKSGDSMMKKSMEYGLIGMREQMAFNAREALNNRIWQEKVLKKQHRWEMKDLKLAGLNPILTATGGTGVGPGSGSAASISNPNLQSSVDAGTSAKQAQAAVFESLSRTLYNVMESRRSAAETASKEQMMEIKKPVEDLADDLKGSITGVAKNFYGKGKEIGNEIVDFIKANRITSAKTESKSQQEYYRTQIGHIHKLTKMPKSTLTPKYKGQVIMAIQKDKVLKNFQKRELIKVVERIFKGELK